MHLEWKAVAPWINAFLFFGAQGAMCSFSRQLKRSEDVPEPVTVQAGSISRSTSTKIHAIEKGRARWSDSAELALVVNL